MQSNTKAAALLKRAKHSSMLGTVVALLIVVVVMSIASDTFFTSSNLVNLIRQGSVLAVVAIGQTYVIISGGIDLSVAPLISLSTVITASLVTNNGIPWGAAAVAAILACTLCGILNGSIITYIKIPPIIATLATTMGRIMSGLVPEAKPRWAPSMLDTEPAKVAMMIFPLTFMYLKLVNEGTMLPRETIIAVKVFSLMPVFRASTFRGFWANFSMR